MIYLKNITTEQYTLIPSNGRLRDAYCKRFTLRNSISGEAIMTEDYGGIPYQKGYYALNITLPQGMPIGEFTYSLTAEDGYELASGLCQIGEYHKPIQQAAGSGFTLKQAK